MSKVFDKRTSDTARAAGESEFKVNNARKRGTLTYGEDYIVDSKGCALFSDSAAQKLRQAREARRSA